MRELIKIDGSTVYLCGVITKEKVFQLRHSLKNLAKEHTTISLDMENTEYIDSASWGILILLNKELIEKGGIARITNASPLVHEAIKLSCLKDFFESSSFSNQKPKRD